MNTKEIEEEIANLKSNLFKITDKFIKITRFAGYPIIRICSSHKKYNYKINLVREKAYLAGIKDDLTIIELYKASKILFDINKNSPKQIEFSVIVETLLNLIIVYGEEKNRFSFYKFVYMIDSIAIRAPTVLADFIKFLPIIAPVAASCKVSPEELSDIVVNELCAGKNIHMSFHTLRLNIKRNIFLKEGL